MKVKLVDYLRRFLLSCLWNPSSSCATTTKNGPSASLANNISEGRQEHPKQRHDGRQRKEEQEAAEDEEEEEEEEEDSLIDAAASPFHHHPSPSRSLVVGTIYGQRHGHVSFCVQSDPTVPPPFLFELSIPTAFLAREMRSGVLRVSLECHRDPASTSRGCSGRSAAGPAWKAYCNGRKVGFAVRRRPGEKDISVLETLKSVSAGAGVLQPGKKLKWEKGEVMYVRASYERVVGSRDSVSYHLINPDGSPSQELSVFLLRNR